MVKLSEILKENCYTSEMSKELHSKDTCPRCKSNTALTSCDREIDREALMKSLAQMIKDATKYNSGEIATDNFISTMPNWLKRIEK